MLHLYFYKNVILSCVIFVFFFYEWHRVSSVTVVLFLCKRYGLSQGSSSSAQDLSADIRDVLIKSFLIRGLLTKASVSFLSHSLSL